MKASKIQEQRIDGVERLVCVDLRRISGLVKRARSSALSDQMCKVLRCAITTPLRQHS